MSFKQINEEMRKLLEDQYEEQPETEKTYLVNFTDSTKDNGFSVKGYELLYNNERIADLLDPEDYLEISDKINTYCELELNKEVEDIEEVVSFNELPESIKEITRDEWNKTPSDYKMMKDGKPYLVYLDDESHNTVLGPCKIVDESINEEAPEVKLVGHFGDRGGNHKIEMIAVDRDEVGNSIADRVFVDGKEVCTFIYEEGTDSDFAVSIQKIQVNNQPYFNYLVGTAVMDMCQDEETIKSESVNESKAKDIKSYTLQINQ